MEERERMRVRVALRVTDRKSKEWRNRKWREKERRIAQGEVSGVEREKSLCLSLGNSSSRLKKLDNLCRNSLDILTTVV